MTGVSPRRRDGLLYALALFGVIAVLLLGAAVLYVGLEARKARLQGAGAAPALVPDAGVAEVQTSAWRALPADSPLQRASDVAFAPGAALLTDGKDAVFVGPGGAPRPLEVPAAITRVFSAADRLFAAGENDGAPFLILLSGSEDPVVVPMPCRVHLLAGEGQVLVGACEGAGLAVSADGGRTFRPVPFEYPLPRDPPEDGEITRAVEAVSASAGGSLALATSQRWQTEGESGALAWTWGQVAVRPGPGKGLRFSNVHALVRTVGLHLSGGALTLAGLEVALDGSAEGEVHPRLFRGAEGEPPIPVGEPGPVCGTTAEAPTVEGVLLGTRVAAFVCKGRLLTTLDGGVSWKTERALGKVLSVRGGDMRLLARGEHATWERRFVDRSESGATAIRVPGTGRARRDAGSAGPLAASDDIREPADAGAPDATP